MSGKSLWAVHPFKPALTSAQRPEEGQLQGEEGGRGRCYQKLLLLWVLLVQLLLYLLLLLLLLLMALQLLMILVLLLGLLLPVQGRDCVPKGGL